MFETVIELTDKCPLSCLHCSTNASWGASSLLSHDDVQKIVQDSIPLGLSTLVLSGGDPFTHPDIETIISFLSGFDFQLKIYTCGVIRSQGVLQPITKDTFRSIRSMIGDRLSFIFSLHGGTAKVHDQITCTKGSFDILKQSLSNVLSCNIYTELHFVPMKTNISSLNQAYSVVEKLGIKKLSLLRFVPQGRGALNKNKLLITANEKQDFVSTVQRLRNNNSDIAIRTGSPFNCIMGQNKTTCNAGHNRVLINPQGFVFPCEAFKKTPMAGTINVKDYNLKSILNETQLFKDLRERRNALLSVKNNLVNQSDIKSCPAQSHIHTQGKSFDLDPYCYSNYRDKHISHF